MELFRILNTLGGVAISDEDIKIIERLITVDKADVNARDDMNWTPLLYIAAGSSSSWRKRESQILGKLLIDNKADVNAKWTYGQTPLMFTVRNLDLCKSLVENKANLYMMSGKWTPLIYASVYANACLRCSPCIENHDLMKYYVQEMMKPDSTLAVLLLGIKKYRNSPLLKYIDIHMMTKVTRQIRNARKQNLRVQTESIENKDIRDMLTSEMLKVLLPNITIK